MNVNQANNKSKNLSKNPAEFLRFGLAETLQDTVNVDETKILSNLKKVVGDLLGQGNVKIAEAEEKNWKRRRGFVIQFGSPDLIKHGKTMDVLEFYKEASKAGEKNSYTAYLDVEGLSMVIKPLRGVRKYIPYTRGWKIVSTITDQVKHVFDENNSNLQLYEFSSDKMPDVVHYGW